MTAQPNTPGGDRLDVLTTLVEAYEGAHLPIDWEVVVTQQQGIGGALWPMRQSRRNAAHLDAVMLQEGPRAYQMMGRTIGQRFFAGQPQCTFVQRARNERPTSKREA